MINLNKFNLLIAFKSNLIKKLIPGLFVITAITVVFCYLHLKYNIVNIHLSAALPASMGATLGLLLVFRNNTAYERWWEARKEIGALVNTSRNLALNLNSLLHMHNEEKDTISNLLIAFVHSLKSHLRSGVQMDEIKHLIEAEDVEMVSNAGNKPNIIMNCIGQRIEVLYEQKYITDTQECLLLSQVNGLVDILGKCERIKNTPMPIAYTFLLKFFIVIYVMLLPFGMLETIGWWSIPLVMILYYLLMSIVLTAEEIEEPFGEDMNDLKMDQISANIEKNIKEIIKHD